MEFVKCSLCSREPYNQANEGYDPSINNIPLHRNAFHGSMRVLDIDIANEKTFDGKVRQEIGAGGTPSGVEPGQHSRRRMFFPRIWQ